MKVLLLAGLLLANPVHASIDTAGPEGVENCEALNVLTGQSQFEDLLLLAVEANCVELSRKLVHDEDLRKAIKAESQKAIENINGFPGDLKATFYIYYLKDHPELVGKITVSEINDLEVDHKPLGTVLSSLGQNLDQVLNTWEHRTLISFVTAYEDLVRAIIYYGVDLDHSDGWGRNAVYYAAWSDHFPAVKLLVSAGAKFDYFETIPEGYDCVGYWSALYAATNNRNAEMVRYLLNAGASPNRPECDLGRETPLIVAARRNFPESGKLLINAGANLNLKGRYNHTAFSEAVEYGSAEMAQLLIEAGADLDLSNHGKLSKPLIYALEKGYLDLAKVLIAKGLYLNTDAMEKAAAIGSTEIIDLLMKAGVDLGHALSDASASGQIETLKYLLRVGARYQSEALYYAKIPYSYHFEDESFLEIVDLLLAAGADINYSPDGLSSLIYRLYLNSKYELMLKMIDLGARVNLRHQESGKTFVHEVLYCIFGERESQYGRHFCEGWDWPPHYIKTQYWKMGYLKLLIKNGASLTAKDQNGLSATDWFQIISKRNCKRYHPRLPVFHDLYESCKATKKEMKVLYRKYRKLQD